MSTAFSPQQERERANLALLNELLKYQEWCKELDRGRVPDGLREALAKERGEDGR